MASRDRKGAGFGVPLPCGFHLHWSCKDPTEYLDRLVPFLLCECPDALLKRHPELADKYEELRLQLAEEYRALLDAWSRAKDIEDQKAFAKIVVPATAFSPLLFQLRKLPRDEQTEQNLQRHWRKSEGLVAEFLKL